MAIAKEQLRQIIKENDIQSVGECMVDNGNSRPLEYYGALYA